ncbi:MAG: hypothetical protein AVDCRST_MAG27-443, partial [uncultured Craurococcus sp.]
EPFGFPFRRRRHHDGARARPPHPRRPGPARLRRRPRRGAAARLPRRARLRRRRGGRGRYPRAPRLGADDAGDRR